MTDQVPRAGGVPQLDIDQAGAAGAGELRDRLDHVFSTWRGPVVVLVGGAGGMEQQHIDAVAVLVRDHLVPALSRWHAAVVDGGTDAGVMQIIGRARDEAQATFPLIGVAARGTVRHDGQDDPAVDTELEPNHSLVVLVPGQAWGDESRWLSTVAKVLAGSEPSVTLLINGGQIAYADARHSVTAGRPVVVLAGSGRTSDAIAAAASGATADDRAVELVHTGLVHVAALVEPDQVIATLAGLLQVSG